MKLLARLALPLLLFAPCSRAQFGTITFAQGGTIGSTSSGTVAITCAAGSALATWSRVTLSGSFTTTVTDSNSDSFTNGPYQQTTGQQTQMAYAGNIVGGSITVTFTYSTLTSLTALGVWCVPGAATSPFDVQPCNSPGQCSSTSNATTGTTNAFTTTNANDVILMACGPDATNETVTAEAGWVSDATQIPTGIGGELGGAQHLVFSSIQTGITPTMTFSTAAQWSCNAMALKASLTNIPSQIGGFLVGP